VELRQPSLQITDPSESAPAEQLTPPWLEQAPLPPLQSPLLLAGLSFAQKLANTRLHNMTRVMSMRFILHSPKKIKVICFTSGGIGKPKVILPGTKKAMVNLLFCLAT